MNPTDWAVLPGALVGDEVAAALDERTLQILERRRKTTIVKRRGWLVRRMLLAADVLGLTLPFLVAQLLFGPSTDSLDAGLRFLLFVATLPAWIVATKLYGLYDHD